MAKFFFRGNALWVRGTINKVRYQLACGRKKTDLGFNTWYKKANAEQVLKELVEKENEVFFEDIKSFDLETFGLRILQSSKEDRSYETQNDYESLFKNRIIPFFQDPKNQRRYLLKDISKILPLDCVELLRYLKTQFSEERAKRCKTVFSYVLEGAVECKYLGRNPLEAKSVKRIHFDTTPQSNQTYTTQEVKILLDVSKGWFKIFMEILFKHGLRVGEAKGIKWEDVDLEQGKIYLQRSVTHGRVIEGNNRTKKHVRTVNLFPSLVEQLKAYKKVRPSEEWLFVDGDGGYIKENANLLKHLQNLCNEYGVEYKTLKPTRRSHASIMFFGGVEEEKVQEDIGHAKGSKVTLKHYIDRNVLLSEQERRISIKQEEIFFAMIGA